MDHFINSDEFVSFLTWFLSPLVLLYFLAALASKRGRAVMFWIGATLFTAAIALFWFGESFAYSINVKPANELDPSEVCPLIILLGWAALAFAFFLANVLRPDLSANDERPSLPGFEVVPQDKGQPPPGAWID